MKAGSRTTWAIVFSVVAHASLATVLLWRRQHTSTPPRSVHMHLTAIEHHAAAKVVAPPPHQPPLKPPAAKVAQDPQPKLTPSPKLAPAPKPVAKLAPQPAPPTAPKPQLASAPLSKAPEPGEAADEGDSGEDEDDGGDQSTEAFLIRSSLAKPEYTTEALFARVEGLYPMNVKIDVQGHVLGAQLAKKVGYGMDERIVTSVVNARFQPGRDAHGNVVAGWVKIKFKLEIPD